MKMAKLRILVCIKQVPKSAEVKIDPKTQNLKREGIELVINPADRAALAAAKSIGGNIIALSMGPMQSAFSLREALCLGADSAVLASDAMFAGSDTWATSNVLAKAAKKIGFDLILCGKEASDGETAQVPGELAEKLGIPQITFAKSCEVSGERVTATRVSENSEDTFECRLPALVSIAVSPGREKYPSLNDINSAMERKITVMNAAELGIKKDEAGLEPSPTRVRRIFNPPARSAGVRLEGSLSEVCGRLSSILLEKKAETGAKG